MQHAEAKMAPQKPDQSSHDPTKPTRPDTPERENDDADGSEFGMATEDEKGRQQQTGSPYSIGPDKGQEDADAHEEEEAEEGEGEILFTDEEPGATEPRNENNGMPFSRTPYGQQEREYPNEPPPSNTEEIAQDC